MADGPGRKSDGWLAALAAISLIGVGVSYAKDRSDRIRHEQAKAKALTSTTNDGRESPLNNFNYGRITTEPRARSWSGQSNHFSDADSKPARPSRTTGGLQVPL